MAYSPFSGYVQELYFDDEDENYDYSDDKDYVGENYEHVKKIESKKFAEGGKIEPTHAEIIEWLEQHPELDGYNEDGTPTDETYQDAIDEIKAERGYAEGGELKSDHYFNVVYKNVENGDVIVEDEFLYFGTSRDAARKDAKDFLEENKFDKLERLEEEGYGSMDEDEVTFEITN